jgi:hypothetical protein
MRDDADEQCPTPKAHVLEINPDNIKLGFNGILKKSVKLVMISVDKCVQKSLDAIQLAKEVAVSFLGLIISNLIKELLFSFLNNKDLFDVIRYDNLPKGERYKKFDSFFSTFDCKSFPHFFEDYTSFKSNTFLKSFFIPNYTDLLNTPLFNHFESEWLKEYKQQSQRKMSSYITSGLNCRFNLIFPEYMTLFFLIIFWILYILYAFVYFYHRWNAIKKSKTYYQIKRIYKFWYRLFINSLLLVYYYNLISFCFLIKLLNTVYFGYSEFLLMVIRGAFIMFPLFNFLKELNKKNKEIKKQKLKKKNKKKKSKSKINKNKNLQNNRIQTSKKVKENNQIPNTFTKELPTKTVYATWIIKKNKILIYIRTFFKKLFFNKRKLNLFSVPNLSVTPVIKPYKTEKYVLEIVEPKNSDKPKPLSIY